MTTTFLITSTPHHADANRNQGVSMVPTCVPTDTTLGPPTAANLASRGDQPPFLPSTSLTTSTRDAVPTRRRTACRTDDVQNARPLRPDATTSFTKVGPLAYPPQEGRRLLDFHLDSTSATDGRRLHLSDPNHDATTPRAPISLVRPTLTPLTFHLDSISTRRSTKHHEQHARSIGPACLPHEPTASSTS